MSSCAKNYYLEIGETEDTKFNLVRFERSGDVILRACETL